MKNRASTIALTLLLSSLVHGESHVLKFVKAIGVGRNLDKYGWMNFVAFNQDGTMVASNGSASPDDVSGNLSFWSFPEGALVKQLAGWPTSISADWRYYASNRSVVEVETGRPRISRTEKEYAVYAFSPDGRYVAESRVAERADVSSIRVLDLSSDKPVSAFGKHRAFSLAISPNGMILASGHWDIVTLWNLFTGQRVGVLRGFGRYVEGLSFSKDGKLLAGGTDFGGLQIWDVSRGTRLHSLTIEGGNVSQPAFSPDGRLLAIGVYGTGSAWLIDVGTGRILESQKVSDLGCGSVAFSPDGRFLIAPPTGGLGKWPYDHGGTIRVFEVAD